jgi:signal transduction histidine kinase
LHQKLLTLVDCILRSASTDDDQLSASTAAALLAELAKEDPLFANWFPLSQPVSNQQCASGLASPLPPADWDAMLRQLCALAGTCETLACLRQAAHTALRLRQLQSRFEEDVERVKLDAIYHFAYGLSHELNNPLANIASRAGLLIQSTTHPDHLQMLHAIADSAMRGCEMLGDLMLTARPPRLQPAPVELSQLKETFLERGNRWTELRTIQFALTWQAQGSCQLDSAMLCEIVWSLLRNAIEASSPGGTIRVEVEQELSELRVRIDDEGPGLSQTALQHCFDPYFSGREAGRGLGLGLTKAKRLAQLHGGDVTIENRPARGCRATVRIETQ